MKLSIIILLLSFLAVLEATESSRVKRKPNVYIEVDLDEGPGGPGDGSRVIMISERQIASLLRDFKNICVKISSLKSFQNSEPADVYGGNSYPNHVKSHYSTNMRNHEVPVYPTDEDFPHEVPNNAHKSFQNEFPPTVIDPNGELRNSNFLNAMRNGFMCTTCNRNSKNEEGKKKSGDHQTKTPRSLNESEKVFDDEVHFNVPKTEPERFMLDLPPISHGRTLLKRESRDFSKKLQRTIKMLEKYDPRIKEGIQPTEETGVERPNSVEFPVINE